MAWDCKVKPFEGDRLPSLAEERHVALHLLKSSPSAIRGQALGGTLQHPAVYQPQQLY